MHFVIGRSKREGSRLKIGDVREILTFSITQGYRTVSQQVEMIVREWLKEHGHLKEDQKK